LGRYCDLTPQSLRFSVTAAGKPSLAGQGTTTPPLHFNLTHSDERALLGLSLAGGRAGLRRRVGAPAVGS